MELQSILKSEDALKQLNTPLVQKLLSEWTQTALVVLNRPSNSFLSRRVTAANVADSLLKANDGKNSEVDRLNSVKVLANAVRMETILELELPDNTKIGFDAVAHQIVSGCCDAGRPFIVGDIDLRAESPFVPQDALHIVENCMRQPYAAGPQTNQYLKQMAAFLLLAAPSDVYKNQIFTPEMDINYVNPDGSKAPLAAAIYLEAKKDVSKIKLIKQKSDRVVNFCLGPAAIKTGNPQVSVIKKHFGVMSQCAQSSITTAVAYLEKRRKEKDAPLVAFLSEEQKRPGFAGKAASWAHSVLKSG